ncbi:MAG: DUF1592 domain-containing protein [Deltaproteobacteria bacterium]|nr:DUF1592 domain-containing protein [Deltaproteobacteria bacterium]
MGLNRKGVRVRWLATTTLALVGGCYQGLAGQGRGDGDTLGGSDGSGSSGAGGSDDGGGPAAIEQPLQPLHRLNRLEYNNTVRDLLGTTTRPADAFGPDPEANGFDNMAAQLSISSTLLDGYASAARDAIADGVDERPIYRERFAMETLGVQGGYAIGALWALSGAAVDVTLDVEAGGDSELVLTAGISLVGAAPTPEVAIELDGVVVAGTVVSGSGAIPVDHVFPVALTAGAHHLRVIPTNFINDPAGNVTNNVFVASLTARSIATAFGPGRSRVYVCEPVEPTARSCYGQIIRNFAFRAWRRPLQAGEGEGLEALFDEVVAGGESPEDALRLVMRAVMLSPKFLYRMRTTDDEDGDGWLDDYVLASRLSYFLWSSMPDDRLFDAAAKGELATDEGLSEAVAWMLADDRAIALQDGFAEQWLSTRYLQNASPSPEIYPQFDENLRAAMTAESKLFFGDFLFNALPASMLIKPDFAYRNDRLALHYGAVSPGTNDMRRVPVAPGERGGLLSLGAWLTAQSDAEHSSPIRRGRWLSDRLLCSPVPPPPAGLVVNPIHFADDASVREQLEMHRSEPGCASCHSLLDVLGIGLEEYDGVAALRTEPNLDNAGELPDGRTFEGAAGLADLYVESDVFVGCLTQKLFTYAVGRAPETFDRDTLEELARVATERGDDVATIIDAIVHTPAFRSPAALEGGS